MNLTREQVRDLDHQAIEEFGVPGIVLMENAGRGAAEVLLSLGVNGKVVLCCGKGNNAGDGLVISRHLDNHRVPVQILLFTRPEKLTGDAATNYQIAAKSELPICILGDEDIDSEKLSSLLTEADWIVDALFGTGLQGPVRPPLDGVITAINGSGRRVLAVDLPSGLDCDTGRPMGATVRANHTVTFVAPKKGFECPDAANWVGRVHVVDIGAPRVLVDSYAAPDS
ncbi:MAG: NAD(P)H-hydrate epimerase [Gemmataceae bacterium]